jgi:thiamine monophosphate synthase
VIGPVFATVTHPGRPALGLDGFAEIAALGLPAVAIGGVTPDRGAALRAAGAHGVAAIRALWDADDPGDAARNLLNAFAE